MQQRRKHLGGKIVLAGVAIALVIGAVLLASTNIPAPTHAIVKELDAKAFLNTNKP